MQDAGLPVQDMTKDTVAGLLEKPLLLAPYKGVREALEFRQEGNRTSTAKLRSMLGAVGADSLARGLFAYYGAGRTGRFSSKRVQFQNLARSTIKDATGALNFIIGLSRDLGLHRDEIAEAVYLLFPDTPLGVIASCLRGCIVAHPGHLLTVADLCADRGPRYLLVLGTTGHACRVCTRRRCIHIHCKPTGLRQQAVRKSPSSSLWIWHGSAEVPGYRCKVWDTPG